MTQPTNRRLVTEDSLVNRNQVGPTTLLEVEPETPGHATFVARVNRFPNYSAPGVPDGTYNQTFHMGPNAGRHASGSVTDDAPALYFGIEDNYFDYGGDETYGMEGYAGFATPDGTTIRLGRLRPWYFRVLHTDTNDADDKSVLFNINLGEGPAGYFAVGNQYTNEALFSVTRDQIQFSRQGQFLDGVRVMPPSGTAKLSIASTGGDGDDPEDFSAIGFGIDYTEKWGLVAGPTTFTLDDIAHSANVIAVTAAATAALRLLQISARVQVDSTAALRDTTIIPAAGAWSSPANDTPALLKLNAARNYEVRAGNSATDFNYFAITDKTASKNRIGISPLGTVVIGEFESVGLGGAARALAIQEVTTAPATTPVGGGVIYVQSGILKYKGPSGTVTPIAVA